MRIRLGLFARVPSSALGASLSLLLSCAISGAISACGCSSSSSSSDDDDSGADDTGDTLVDTGIAPSDAISTFAVVVPASVLVGGTCDGAPCDVRDLGGGSTKADLVPSASTGGGGVVLYDAYATITTDSGAIMTSNEITGSGGTYVDGRITGLQVGVPVTIRVTGYLRGKMGSETDPSDVQIPWAAATCTAVPSPTADVQATCTRVDSTGDRVACTQGCLELIGTHGILFTSDVLPSGYCAGKGATDFSLLTAQGATPATDAVWLNESDCRGVVWIPLDGTWTEGAPGVSDWSLSLLPKTAGEHACTLTTPCHVDRNDTPGACAAGSSDCAAVRVVGSECQLSNASTGGACF